MSSSDKKIAPVIYALATTNLQEEERRFFEQIKPAGFILFARNCKTPDQVKRLTDDLCALYEEKILILIDQEGGKVAPLKSPPWPDFPSAQFFGELYARDREKACRAVYENARAIADTLIAIGINVNCAPVLDVPVAGADPIIGSRAFGADAAPVSDLGSHAIAGLKAGGVMPVIKHLPGHGRAGADSHRALPIVDTSLEVLSQTDFLPFANHADTLIGMTAHILFTALDPDLPSTLSKRIINDIVRDQIGFDGLLLTDDINMRALSGDRAEVSTAALAAGCDIVLHCSGDLGAMRAIADRLPSMAEAARRRLDRVLSHLA